MRSMPRAAFRPGVSPSAEENDFACWQIESVRSLGSIPGSVGSERRCKTALRCQVDVAVGNAMPYMWSLLASRKPWYGPPN